MECGDFIDVIKVDKKKGRVYSSSQAGKTGADGLGAQAGGHLTLTIWTRLAAVLSRFATIAMLADAMAWDRDEKLIDLYVLLSSPDDPEG